MELKEAKQLAEELMHEYKVPPYWKFRFNNAKRRFGCCSYIKMEISLSKEITKLNEKKHVRNTILHEIAHVLNVSRDHHGKNWKKIAISIGCNGSTTYSRDVIKPKPKYKSICPNGHIGFGFRKTKRPMSCGRCSSSFNRDYLLKTTHNHN